MSEIKVNSIKGVGASAAAITVDNSSGSATANLTTVNSVTMPNDGFLSNRNIVINGAMLVAQRGTSSTSNIYQTVDRMAMIIGGTDENPTQAQVDVASGTTPYSLGFRKAFKITNGNQTGGLGTNDIIEAIRYRVEAQDIANSGWNYTDSNSFITLSFWVKSSVSFNMKGYFYTEDNSYNYPLETGTLTADTWTKITRTIPGNSNLVFNNDNDHGLTISFGVYGTLYSSGNPSVNQWVAYSSATLTNPSETTWYTTNDATLEFTGLQLEVGSVATDFEHRSFGQELVLCQRYYYTTKGGNDGNPNSDAGGFFGVPLANSQGGYGIGNFPVAMRANPTIVLYDATATSGKFTQNGINYFTGNASGINTNGFSLISGASGVSTGTNYTLTAGFTADAEL